MPDVSRSDSQRSDASQRPRVSFNRDVHVKRISTVASPRPPVEGGSLRLPVRRRLSRREGVAEARRALQQADQVACSASLLDLGDGFRSLRLPSKGRKARPLASTTAVVSTSLTDLSAQPDRPKRRKEANGSTGSRGGSKLKRSQSERSSERPRRDPISAAFHSLERKRHKSKALPEDSKQQEQDPQLPAEDTPISPPRRRHHSANSDRSPSPRPRKNILKKSLSDSEAKPEDATTQPPSKKQLSPIIEDAPRAGYDFSADAPASDAPAPTAMHSSQAPADRPPVTRGRTVETLVRRLSQETLNHKNKKPPRGLSPSALVAPGEERRHNNNLPFSYTEPPPQPAHGDRSTAAASAGVEGVIYAEVVVGGGGSGKQTVHTQVPQRAAPPPQADAAAADDDDEVDEGVGLSMDYGARNQLATDFRRANGYHSESRETAERALPGGGKASTARREFAYSGVSPDGAYKKEYLVQESSSRYESSDLGLERGRADGMDSRRKDFLAERYDDGERLFDPRPRKSFDLDDPRLYKDSLNGADFYGGRETPVIHDLSSRRDRLESRIESQRKERFSSYNKRDLSESVKKYATDPPRKAAAPDPRRYSNRRDFLASQIDLDDEVDDNVRYENDRNRRKSAASTRYLDLSTTSSTTKKDFFADSGIEVDYRSKEPRRYDDVQTVEGPSAKIFIGGGRGSSSSPSSTNVTRVELRTGATPTTTPTPAATPTPALASDAEDDPRPGRHFYSSRTATATAANFSSTRLVQERHRTGGDVLPASTVLIRHYAAAEDRSREPSPKHRDREFPDPSPKHRDREFLDPSPKHNDREYRDPSPKHREREYRDPSPKDRDREYLDPSPKHREREYRDPSPKHRDREYRDRDKDRERERDRDRERARDLDRERASRESRERRERHEHSAITSTASRTLSRTQREQRASEKLIRVERLAHGPEASDIDLDLDGRHSALDDTDVDERHYQRRRREDDDEDLRSRRKKPSKKAQDLREEQEEQEDVRESEAEESRRVDTIKRGGTLRAEDQQRKKGPAPALPKKDKDKKKQGSSAMDKVKQLFGGGSSKKDKKKKKEKGQKEEADRKREEGQEEEEEDPVAARYTEYRGDRLLDTDEETLRATPHSTRRGNTTDAELSSQTLKREQVSGSRQRLATPSPAATPSPGVLRHTRDRQREAGWFKSLDRLTSKSHGHTRARDKSDMETTDAGVTEDEASPRHHSTPGGGGGGKSLRFFGDTDAESVISIPPPAAPLSRRYKTNSALQASSKTLQVPTSSGAPSSGTLKAGNERRHHRSAGDVATSSAESTTEGDSSQQSQRSVVYLHAATVGDIPGPRSHATARRAQSREELSSVTSSQLQPQTKTISRSISVLAPWRPKHAREALEVHYTNEDNNRNYIKNGRPPKAPSSGSQHRQPPAGSGATTSRAVSRRRSGGADAASKIHAKQKVAKATSIESLSHKNGASGGVRHTLEMRNSAKKRAAGGSSLGPAGSVESLSRHSDHSNARLRGKDRSSGSGKNSALNASAVELSTADTNGRGYKSSTHKKDTDRAKDSGKVSRSASMPKDTRVTAGWFKLRNKKQGT